MTDQILKITPIGNNMKRCHACLKLRPPKSFEHAEPICATCWVQNRSIRSQQPPVEPAIPAHEARRLLTAWARGLSPAERESARAEVRKRGMHIGELVLAGKQSLDA